MVSKIWLMFMLLVLAMVVECDVRAYYGLGGGIKGSDAKVGDVNSNENSGPTHRLLGERKYISYGALRANAVPCNKPGHSYYHCSSGPATRANPYTRGCNAITRCQRYTG